MMKNMETTMDQETANLPALAKEINVRFQKADQYQGKADDHRIAAGILLLQAREVVKANGLVWGAWLLENVKRSRQDVYKVMALAAAPDPQAAREAEKAATRASVQKHRETRA